MSEECAICVLDNYHDSDQFICDDCNGELDDMAAFQDGGWRA